MSHKIFISVTLLLSVMMVLGEHLVQPGPPDFCIKDSSRQDDKFHKYVPSPEMGDLHNCSAWQNLSCCTQALAEELSRNLTMALYNWTHDVCGNLSTKCAEFMKVCIIITILSMSVVLINVSDMPFCCAFLL